MLSENDKKNLLSLYENLKLFTGELENDDLSLSVKHLSRTIEILTKHLLNDKLKNTYLLEQCMMLSLITTNILMYRDKQKNGYIQ